MCCALRNIKYFIMLQLSFSGLSDWQVYTAEESSLSNPIHEGLRLNIDKYGTFAPGGPTESAQGAADRYKRTVTSHDKAKKTRAITRSTLLFISQRHYCDYMAKHCLHAYVTGKICAVTIYDRYETYATYCLMEYVNCREGSEIWRIAHTGACFSVPEKAQQYMVYAYHNDYFLDDYYILDDKTTLL